MRVVITGGTGLIGRALSASLAADGHEVIVLSRSPDRTTGLPAGVRAVGWDAQTAAGWVDVADGAAAIVNLAGENIAGQGLIPGRWTEERKRRILRSRLDAGRAVVEAVEAAGQKPGVVVQASGIGFYGPRGDEIVTEDAAAGNDFLARVGIGWEASTEAVEARGVRRVVVRSAGVLTPAGGVLPRLLLPVRLFVGGPIGGGRQWVPWIHIADEVRAIRFLIEQESARGAFNLAAPQPVTNAAFIRTLGEVLGRPTVIPMPAFAPRLAFGELATVLLDGQRAVPQRLEEQGFSFRFSQLEGALRDLLE